MSESKPAKPRAVKSIKPAPATIAAAPIAPAIVTAPIATPAPVIADPAPAAASPVAAKPKPSVAKPAPAAAAAPVTPPVAKPAEPAPAPVAVAKPAALPVPAEPIAAVATIEAPAVAVEKAVAKIVPQTVGAFASVNLTKLSKGLFSMATTPEAFTTTKFDTDKVQAMFGDVSARAKQAFEKSQKFGEELQELTKGNIEAIVASAKVAAKGAESLGAEAADYSKKRVESTTAAFKSFASVKSPTELFQLQSEFAKSSFDSAVAESSRFSEAMVKLAGDVFQPISSRYAVVAEKMKAVAL